MHVEEVVDYGGFWVLLFFVVYTRIFVLRTTLLQFQKSRDTTILKMESSVFQNRILKIHVENGTSI